MNANKKAAKRKYCTYISEALGYITTGGVFVNVMTMRRFVNVKECEHECLLREKWTWEGIEKVGHMAEQMVGHTVHTHVAVFKRECSYSRHKPRSRSSSPRVNGKPREPNVEQVSCLHA
jgi:hypothetical protein